MRVCVDSCPCPCGLGAPQNDFRDIRTLRKAFSAASGKLLRFLQQATKLPLSETAAGKNRVDGRNWDAQVSNSCARPKERYTRGREKRTHKTIVACFFCSPAPPAFLLSHLSRTGTRLPASPLRQRRRQQERYRESASPPEGKGRELSTIFVDFEAVRRSRNLHLYRCVRFGQALASTTAVGMTSAAGVVLFFLLFATSRAWVSPNALHPHAR